MSDRLRPQSYLVLIAVLFAASAILTSCDIPRPSKVICDCQIQPNANDSEWRPLDQAPLNYAPKEIRLLSDGPELYFGTPEIFDSADVHWYQSEAGESLGCVVFESSNHVRATIVLPADTAEIVPIDSRLMGIPFGRDRFFWEGCAD